MKKQMIKMVSIIATIFILITPIKAQQAAVSITMPYVYMCVGNNAILDAGGGTCGASYLWAASGETTQTITVSNGGLFVVTITYPDGGVCEKTFIVVYYPSSLGEINVSGTLCSGNNITLSSSAGCNYVWSSNDYTIDSPNSQSLSFIPSNAGVHTFSVTATNYYGCADIKTVSLNVNASPALVVTNSNPSICIGNSSDLSVSGSDSYSWSNGVIGASTTVTPSVTTTYTVTGTNTNGCVSTTTTAVNVATNCPTISSCNKTITNMLGGYITANLYTGATNYEFRFEEVDVNGTIISTTYGTSTNYIMSLIYVNNPGIIHYNAHYKTSVRVSTDNGNTWTPYSSKCNMYTTQPTNTPNNGYCNIHRNNLLHIYSVERMAFATQYKLRITKVGDNDPSHVINYIIPNGSTAVQLRNIPGVVYNTNYMVEISSFVPYSYDNQTGTTVYNWSPYGNACAFYMDQPANNPNNGYCGIHQNNLTEIYSVETMGMSQQYKLRIRVNGDNDPAHYIEYIMPAGSLSVYLSSIQGLTYNTVYTVEISSFVPTSYDFVNGIYNYEWSQYGNPCLLFMDQPANTPANGYCGIARTLNGQYCARKVAGATKYKFRLTENSNPAVVLTSNEFNYSGSGNLCLALNSTNVPGLQDNTHYRIEISTFVPYNYDVPSQTYTFSDWSPYGAQCDLFIGNPPAGTKLINPDVIIDETKSEIKIEKSEELSEKIVLTNDNLSVFPNPSENNINVMIENIVSTNTIAEMTIADLKGRVIISEQIISDEQGKLVKKLNVDELSSGTYIIAVIINTQKITKRFVKQ